MGLSTLNSDEVLAALVPIAVYWVYSGFYILLGCTGAAKSYRLHSVGDEKAKNLVSKQDVVKGVLFQQFMQAAVSILVHILTHRGDEAAAATTTVMAAASSSSSWSPASAAKIAAQCMVAMVVVDTWQFFWHRYMHVNKFLYRHIHSWHHRLVVPYAFGSQYNHPIEGLLLDTVGGTLAFVISGMSPRAAIFFFSFATIKGIDDHCGLWLPGNILQMCFWNNSAYHDVHHQLYGSKFNFAQPFFVTWDKVFGSYMPVVVEPRHDGGLVARPAVDMKTMKRS